MTKHAYVSQHCADDKDIHDLLSSATRTMTSERLLRLGLSRGIMLSPADTRESLIEYLSSIGYDWSQLRGLLDLCDTVDRPEKLSHSTSAIPATGLDLSLALDTLKNERQAKNDESYTIEVTASRTTVDLEYSEFDPAKTRMAQRRKRHLKIHIENSGAELSFRYEANSRSQSVLKALEQIISRQTNAAGGALQPIVLTGVRSPEKRTEFFTHIVTKMPGFVLRDVELVRVHRLPPVESAEDGDHEPIDEGTEEEDPEKSDDADRATSVVRSVLLQGADLFGAEEYTQLRAKGLFISHIVWKSEEAAGERREIVFDAEFEDGPDGSGFRYAIRGFHGRTKKGELKKTREKLAESEKGPLYKIVESTARNAHKMVSES